MFKKGVSGNKNGRPKGALNKNASLKSILEEAFQENREKAEKLILEMFDDKKDFQWLCSLKASLEPKAVEHSGEVTFNLAEKLEEARNRRLDAIGRN